MTGFPDWLEPMAATLTQERFTGPDWIFERKFDGIRLLAFKHGARRSLCCRATGCRRTLARRSPRRSPACRSTTSILDGEVDLGWGAGPGGLSRVRHPVARWPRRDGAAARRAPRAAERAAAATAAAQRAVARRSEALGARLRAKAGKASSPSAATRRYEHRRSQHWLKMKCEATQELVVGGFTDPQGARVGLGALLVGYYERRRFRVRRQGRHRLRHEAAARSARAARRARDPEVAVHEGQGLPRLRAHWVRPEIVVQVASSSGPCTASCGIRGCSACASTRRGARRRAGSSA